MLRNVDQPTFKSRIWSHWLPKEDPCPDIFLTHLGHTRSRNSFRMHQVISELTFYVFMKGNGSFEINGINSVAGPGQIVAVTPDSHISYSSSPESPWEYIWFVIKGAGAELAFEQTGFPPNRFSIDRGWFKSLSEIIFRVQNSYREDHVSPLRSSAFALEMLSVVQEISMAGKTTNVSSLTEKARNVMEEDYHTGIQVEDVASRLRVSRSTLFRHFIKEMGESPKVFLDELRLNRADLLLERGLANVQEVAYACGFQNPHYFSRAYKNRFGLSPVHRKGGGKVLR